jgi:hypothetical protein
MPESDLSRGLAPEERAVLGERVFCEDDIPFAWAATPALPPRGALTRLNGRNESVLRALSMLEEHDESPAEDAERADFRRLEGKLDLAMELLAELVRDRIGATPSVRVRFSAEGVCWQATRAEAEGTLLFTDWWLLPAWPVALRLHAEVAGNRRSGDGWIVCARLVGQTDTVKDWLEKLVFRRHRRAIAQQRVTRAGDAAPSSAERDDVGDR